MQHQSRRKRQIGAIAKAINTHGLEQRMCNMENGKLLSPFVVQLCKILPTEIRLNRFGFTVECISPSILMPTQKQQLFLSSFVVKTTKHDEHKRPRRVLMTQIVLEVNAGGRLLKLIAFFARKRL